MASTMPSDMSADVVVVGAGPGGSSTAYHLARAGLDVILLEKSPFPRDKICGDGLTPAAVHELIAMGVDTTGWMRNRGLTVIGGGHTVHMDWPDQKSLPGYGMTRARMDLDHALAQRAAERRYSADVAYKDEKSAECQQQAPVDVFQHRAVGG